MKKSTFTIITIMLSQLLMAQPVLNNKLNFTLGDSWSLSGYNEVFNIAPGPPGANLVWDFEAIEGDLFFEGNSAICVESSTTHFADSSEVMLSDIAIASIPIDPMEPYIYQYVTSSNSSREYVAMGMYLDGYGSYGTYKEALTDLIFPMEYGESFSFDVATLLFSLEEGYYYYNDSTYVTVEADAWGSITTPVGSFQNVLRLKTTEVSHSWYKYDISEPWVYLGEFTDISYQWYDENIKVPVMTMHEFNFKKDQTSAGFYHLPASVYKNLALVKNGPGGVKQKTTEYSAIYLEEYDFQTSVNEADQTRFNIFPNPANDIVNITSDGGNMTYEVVVYNQLGDQVLKTSITNNVLNVSSLKPGIYILELRKDKALARKKLIIR